VSDLPVTLPDPLARQLAVAFDVEGKIPRALDALGPLSGRDVAFVDGEPGRFAERLAELGARVRSVDWSDTGGHDKAAPWADALVACWSAFRGVDAGEMAEAARIVRPGGRLLVVHDYGRDDVSQVRGGGEERPEYGLWSRRDGPFLANGFKVRVVHCWWTFESVEGAQTFLGEAFGDAGRTFGAALKRPRLSYNVAIYHRTLGGAAARV
jgi:SAM-dependent methyltransferase